MTTTLSLNIDSVPDELKARPQWVLWKALPNKDPSKKPRKVPFQSNDAPAKSDDPTTWTTFDDVYAAFSKGGYSGIGFVFTADDPYCGIDLDDCRDPSTGELTSKAMAVLERFADTYQEWSQSGAGAHIICRAKLPIEQTGKKSANHEMYHHGRYFVFTGQTIGAPKPITNCQSRVADQFREWWPKAVKTNGKPPTNASVLVGSRNIERCRRYIAKMPDAINGQGGHDRTFSAACECYKFGLTGEEAIDVMRWFNETKTGDEPWTDRELEHKLRGARDRVQSAGEYGCRVRDDETPRVSVNPSSSPQRVRPRTDLGNAERLIDQHGENVRYCWKWGKWLAWDGRRWQIDEGAIVEKLAQQTVRNIYREAALGTDEIAREAIAKWAWRSERREKISAMVAMARCRVSIGHRDLNATPWLLNVENGTLNLETGKLQSHRREDYITAMAPVSFDIDANAPRWWQFLREIFADNHDVMQYVRQLVGYSLTGAVRDHIMPILWGSGANGKSTFVGAIMDLLGPDYSSKADRTLLMLQRHETHPTSVADLFGKRFVAAVETGEGRRLNEPLVKELTGGDRITARRMREDFWQFDPSHKIWLATNHKPVIRGTDQGIWRRLKLIPFTVPFPPEKQDPTLGNVFREEASGIVSWAMVGLQEWAHSGLDEPEVVTAATDVYRHDNDVIGQFIDECCEIEPMAEARASELHKAYRDWCEVNGHRHANQTIVGNELESRGHLRVKRGGKVYRQGIAVVKTEQHSPQAGQF